MKLYSQGSDGGIDRYPELERIKGLAISLVVWGHLASATFFTFPLWFLISISVIYSFHMPLFMYVSGFVFFHSRYHERFWKSPSQYIVGRLDRLIIPFLAIGLIIVCGKYALGSLGGIPDPVESLGAGIWDIVVNSPGNPAASIWYLIVLFSYTIATPILIFTFRSKVEYLLIFSACLWFSEVTEYLYIDRILRYYLFFVVGGVVASNYDVFKAYLRKWWFLSIIVFLSACWFFHRGQYALLICGICSIPAVHGLLIHKIFENDRILKFLGGQTMVIYIFNTIIIGIFNVLLLKIFGRSSPEIWILPVVFIFATFLPILFRKTLERISIFSQFRKYIS